jgi:acyl carrier protein
LRFVVSGGAPLGADVQDGLERALGVPVLEHYGLTEAAQIAANIPSHGRSKRGTCGTASPGTVMVASDHGTCAPGEIGEVHVRGATVMPGYLDNPDANREAFVDGWFRTGDLGSIDHDGFLTLHGRAKELINRGGEKIAPAEVEAAMLRHPAVSECAAFGIAHPRLGDEVAVAVVLRTGMTASGTELKTFASKCLAPFKIPRHIEFVDQLPRGSTGKIQRWQLRDRPAASQTAAATLDDCSLLAQDLTRLWQAMLKCEAVGLDDDFFAKGGDSLLALEMLLTVEEMTGLVLPPDSTMLEAPTIRLLMEYVERASRSDPPRLFKSQTGDPSRPPLFFFHGCVGPGGYYVRHLARALGPEQSLVAVHPHRATRDSDLLSFQEMAAECVPLLLAEQAEGPFRLGGWCKGALVAFEVARILKDEGHDVDLVAMVDPPTFSASPSLRLLCSTASRLVPGFRSDPDFYHAVIGGKINKFARLLELRDYGVLAGSAREAISKLSGRSNTRNGAGTRGTTRSASPAAEDWDMLQFVAYSRLFARYEPRPLDVPVVYFAASHSGRGWARITPKLDIVEIPTSHDGCRMDVATWAVPLRDHLQSLCSDYSGLREDKAALAMAP